MTDGTPVADAAAPFTPSRSVSLALLGYPSLTIDGEPQARSLPGKALALLAYLAMEDQRRHSRDELATLLWPQAAGPSARNSLRQAIHALRQSLPSDRPLLSVSRQNVGLDPEADLWLDVQTFTTLFDACERHAHRRLDSCPACVDRLTRAEALYRDDFLAGFSLPDADLFDSWQTAHRDGRRSQMLTILGHLAAFCMRRQEHGQAINHLQRALALAPWEEETHRQLMRALALAGQRSAALNQYEICRRQLAEELDVAPADETTTLRDQIEAGMLEREVLESANPYRGLFAFDEQHADDFYGRERLVQRLLDTVTQAPLLAVVGPSGSGKSSLLHAGLLPRLRAGDLISSSPVEPYNGGEGTPWIVADFRPGDDPFRSFAEALSPLLSPVQDDEALADALRHGSRSLADLATAMAAPGDRVLIVIDQFEELYTLCPDAQVRQGFLDLLLPAGPSAKSEEPPATENHLPIPTPRSQITVLLSLRADFMGQALAHRPLADALQQGVVLVGPMIANELRQAVEQPARNRGVNFERGLVARLLADVGDDPGNLPLLQFCLTQLWGRQVDGTLTHAAYDDIGGLAGALSRYAEHSFERLSDDQKAVARRTLTRLVQPGEATVDTRRWASRRELGAEGWQLVQQLADARLVVTDLTVHDREQAALVHEALIQHWKRLHVWLEQDQARRLLEHRLLPFLRRWEATDRDPDELLRGAFLTEAEDFARSKGLGTSDREHGFVQASITARDEDQARLERSRQSELEQAQTLAESKQREAEIANRSRRRLRRMAIGLAVVLVLALSATWIAVGQNRVADDNASAAVKAQATAEASASVAAAAQSMAEAEGARAEREAARAEAEAERAEAQAQLALSRQLGAQAVSLANEELDTAVLLSLESLRTSTSAMDRRALHAELSLPPFLSTILQGPAEPIYHLGANSDDASLLSAGERGLFVRWDLAGGQAFSVTPPTADASDTDSHEARGFVSPDGRLAGETHGSGVTLWDLVQGEVLFSAPEAHTGEIRELFFTADGKRMLSRGEEGDLHLWNTDFTSETSASRLLARPTTVENGIVRAMSPAGDKLAMTLEPDSTSILLWDLEAEEAIGQPMPAHTAEIHGWAFSPDGNLLATASFDGSVRLWDAVQGAPLLEPLLAHDGRVLTVAFSPDGRTLACGGTDGLIHRWDTATGTPIDPPLSGHGNWVRALRYSDDGETLFSADADGRVLVWDVGAQRTLRGHEKRVRGVGISPDGRFLITSSFDFAIVLWDAESGEQVRRIDNAHASSIIQIAVSPDGQTIASGDAAGAVKLWEMESLEPLPSPSLSHESVVISLAFSPDGTILATGDFGGQVRRWDVATAEPIGTPLQAHDGWALSLAFSPDGAILASGGSEGDIKRWRMAPDAEESDPLEQLGETMTGHSNWVTWLAFDPDGSTLVSTSSDRTIRFWHALSGAPWGEALEQHDVQVWSSLFDPASAGQVLVTLGGDGSVLRWDVASRELLGPALHTDKETETMAISPDGRSLLIGSFDETAARWRLETRSWSERACHLANRNLDEVEWEHFMADRPYHKVCADLP